MAIEVNKLEELTVLLKKSIAICDEDRKLAKDNYTNLREQLDVILEKEMEGSEEFKLESEVNKALKLVFESANRMEAVISTISKVLISQINNESRERVAANIFGGGDFNGNGMKRIVTSPVNLKEIMDDND